MYLSGVWSSCYKTAAKISGHLFNSKPSAMLEKKSWLLSTRRPKVFLPNGSWISLCRLSYHFSAVPYVPIQFCNVTHMSAFLDENQGGSKLSAALTLKLWFFFIPELRLISFHILPGKCSPVNAHILWKIVNNFSVNECAWMFLNNNCHNIIYFILSWGWYLQKILSETSITVHLHSVKH